MAFLALSCQKSLLTMQRNFFQLQLNSIMNQSNAAQAEMNALKKAGQAYASEHSSTYNEDEDLQYLYWEQIDEQLQSEKDSLEEELQVIDNEINSLKQLVNNNIKSTCTLNLSTGG